jgi:hypothetical protein
MGVVFEEIIARVEPEATPRQDQDPPSPPKEAQRDSIRAELAHIAQRAARLRAD